MQDDEQILRSILTRDPDELTDPALNPERVMIRARHLRTTRQLTLVFASILVVAAVGAPLILISRVGRSSRPESALRPAFQGDSQAAPAVRSDSELAITNLKLIGVPEEGQQSVTYDIEWTGTEFPGVRDCTWTALDERGAEVGSFTDLVVAMSPATGANVHIPVTSPATSATGSCGLRLDVGRPYEYQFSNMEILSSRTEDGVGEVQISFDADWMATGQPGVVVCDYAFASDQGETIYSGSASLFIADGHATGFERWFADEALANLTPASVSVSCSPFTG
jgi:hypothetical protein